MRNGSYSANSTTGLKNKTKKVLWRLLSFWSYRHLLIWLVWVLPSFFSKQETSKINFISLFFSENNKITLPSQQYWLKNLIYTFSSGLWSEQKSDKSLHFQILILKLQYPSAYEQMSQVTSQGQCCSSSLPWEYDQSSRETDMPQAFLFHSCILFFILDLAKTLTSQICRDRQRNPVMHKIVQKGH